MIKTILGGIILIVKFIMLGTGVAAGLLIIECEYIYIYRTILIKYILHLNGRNDDYSTKYDLTVE